VWEKRKKEKWRKEEKTTKKRDQGVYLGMWLRILLLRLRTENDKEGERELCCDLLLFESHNERKCCKQEVRRGRRGEEEEENEEEWKRGR
jgi:hypothetical protein